MTHLALMHAGSAAPDLKNLIAALDSVGVREKYLMEDLVATLRYVDDFSIDLNTFLDEILNSAYLKDRLTKGNCDGQYEEITTKFLDYTAVASKKVATFLHEALITQNRYDVNGKFPYEFHSFNGKIILFRPLETR